MALGLQRSEYPNVPDSCLFLPDDVWLPVNAGKEKGLMLDELVAAMLRYTDRREGPSPYLTAIGTVCILRSDHPNPPVHRLSQPAMCIVAQGEKWASFGGTRYAYKAGEALIVGVEAPSVGRVSSASPERPCLVLAFELDLAIMRSVAAELKKPPKASSEISRGVFVTDFLGPLADCALRLVKLLDTPDAIPVLYPLVMREICYWLLTGPYGGDVARMALANTASQGVLNAIRWLRDNLARPIRVEELATVAQMSLSAFHRHFRALTSLSPLQYQKQLRLLEARRLMVSRGANVEAAAFQVGYESASQFSREYSRMFGEPPKRNVKGLEARADEAARRGDGEAVARGVA
nr:HTH-type transcriptional activator RhaS [Paraburkholderia busanensis]